MTYADLYAGVLNYIKSSVHNVDAYSSSVPASFKTGYSAVEATSSNLSYTVTDPYQGTVVSKDEPVKVTATIVNTVANETVPASTVASQLQSFLTARGISYTSTSPITARGVVNFFNNIASFLTARITIVSGRIAGATHLPFYNKDPNITYPGSVPTLSSEQKIAASDVNTMLSQLTSTLNNVSKSTVIKYSLSYTSTCSCSSSCSSSSSSSSSSCSSIFIAYFNPTV